VPLAPLSGLWVAAAAMLDLSIMKELILPVLGGTGGFLLHQRIRSDRVNEANHDLNRLLGKPFTKQKCVLIENIFFRAESPAKSHSKRQTHGVLRMCVGAS
jgi:hypothetical protein